MNYDVEFYLGRTFVEILEKCPTVKFQNYAEDAGYIYEVNDYPLIQMQPNSIRQIKSQIEQGVKFHVPFCDVEYNFCPPDRLVEKIISLISISDRLRAYYTSYLVHYFMMWVINARIEKISKNFHTIMRIFEFHPINEYSNIFLHCHFIFIKTMTELHIHPDVFDECYSFISDVYLESSQLPAYSFEILPEILRASIGIVENEFPASSIKFTTIITVLLQKYSKDIKHTVIEEIYDIIFPYLSELDFVVLSFFSDISKYIDPKISVSFISSLALLFWVKVCENEPYVQTPEKSAIQDEYKEGEFSIPDVVDISKPLCVFPEAHKNKLSPPYISNYIPILEKITSSQPDFYIDVVGGMIALIQKNSENDRVWDYLFIFVRFLLFAFNRQEQFPDPLYTIFKSFVFSSEYSAFSPQKGFESVNLCRTFLVRILLNTDSASVQTVMNSFLENPLILSELFERFIVEIKLLRSLFSKDKKLFLYLATIANTIMKINNEKPKIAFLRLINEILKEGIMQKFAFATSEFSNFYVNLISYPSTKPNVLPIISSFLSKQPSTEFIVSVRTFLTKKCSEFPDTFAFDTVKEFIDFAMADRAVLTNLSPLVDRILQSFITGLSKNEQLFNVISIDDVNQYVVSISMVDEPSDELMLIYQHMLEKSTLDSVLFEKLQKLIFDQKDEEKKIIKYPLIFKMLVNIFYPLFTTKVLDYISSLCNYSDLNCVSAHRADVNLYLTQKLLEERKGKTIDDELVDQILSLLHKIGSVISSPIIVNKYISLFCSQNGVLSKYYDKYLKVLSDWLQNNLVVPKETIPLEPLFAIEVKMNGTFNPNDGFTFTSWVYLDLVAFSRLFEIFEEKTSYIAFNFKNNKLIWDNGVLVEELPMKKWFFIALTYKAGTLDVFLDGKSIAKFDAVLNPINSKNLTIKIGGSQAKCGEIGSHGLFNSLSSSQIKSIFQLGPRNNDAPGISNLFYKNANEIIELCSLTTKTVSQLNFAETIIRICKLDVLLPLFAQLDLEDANGNTSNRLSTVLNLIKNTITSNEEQEKNFHQEHGFEIIAHLLLSSKYSGFDYGTYILFYNVFIDLSNENLRIDILHYILLNFELWMSGDPLHFFKISSHWKTTLFPIAGPTIITFLSCSTLLNCMRIYCWYLPLETQLIRGDLERKSDMKTITSIRHHIMSIISENYMQHLNVSDFKLLLSQCMSCIDHNQVYDLLLLLNNFSTQSSMAASFFDSSAAYCGLHSLLLNSDEFVSTAAMELIVQIHHSGIIKSCSVQEHLEMIFHELKKGALTQGMLMKISIITQPNAPELFTICCYIANRLGAEENMRMLLERLEPDPDFCIPRNWCIWAVVAAVNSSEELMHMILEFLALCSAKEWLTIYTVIEHVCRAFEKPNEDVKSVFLNIILSLVLSGRVKLRTTDCEILFMMLSTYLFFRDSQTHNPILVELLKKEGIEVPLPTKITPQFREVSTVNQWDTFEANEIWLSAGVEDKNEAESVDIERIVFDTRVPSLQYSIGLRISIDCDWIDHEIASKTLRVQMATKLPGFVDFCFLVCGFLVRTNHPQDEFLKAFEDTPSAYKDFAEGKQCLIEIRNSLFYHEVCDNTARLIDSLRSIRSEAFRKATEIFTLKPKDLEEFSSSNAFETQERIKEELEEGSMSWRVKWSHMTIENAPWDPRSKTNVEKHYKLAPIICGNNCQVLLKRNKNFDSHKIASELRDSGAVFEPAPKVQHKDRILHPLDIVENEKTFNNENNSEFRIIFSTECELVTIKGEKTGFFEMLEDHLRIRIDKKRSILIKINEIEKILLRRKIHRPTAVEIFTYNGQTYFVNFMNFTGLGIIKELRRQYSSLSTKIQATDNYGEFFHSFGFTDKWVNGDISNFDYLMLLNIYSGRSFNDSAQYPFLPWVIKDYTSDKIDINDPKFYRDLTKPIGALGEERLQDLKSRLKDLIQFGVPAFLYSSYYITPLSLYLYLMRMEPFTTLHIEIQSGRFDNAARLFLSVSGAYKSVNTQMNDYRELVPEFYCMPEFLMNIDKFDLGKTEGQRVNDVNLPPWSKNPIDFVYKMRKFLESDIVSATLNDWIDLVWGYKQRGEMAAKYDNIFKHEMYDTIWKQEAANKSENSLRINEIESMINLVGQIPPQLFDDAHAKKTLNKRVTSCISRFIQKNLVLYPASFCSIEEVERGKVILDVLAADMLTKVTISMQNTGTTFEFNSNSTKGMIPLDICECVSLGSKLFVGIGNSRYDIIAFLTTTGACEILPRPRQLVSSISASRGYLAVASEDARVHIFKKQNWKVEISSIPSYRSSINCVCISDEFHTVICGTSDNALLFTSLATNETYRVVEIETTPRHLLVTGAWGFVCVYGDIIIDGIRNHYIDIFNINGMQIRHINVDFDIACWSSFKSQKSFDFIILGTTDGRVFIFEAYFGKIGFPVIDAGEDIKCVQFLPLSSVVIAVTSNRIIIAPFVVDENKLE